MFVKGTTSPPTTQQTGEFQPPKYDGEPSQYRNLTSRCINDLMLDYRIDDQLRDALLQLLESNRATTEFCQNMFDKLQKIERQNQMLLEMIQNQMRCDEIIDTFADEGLTDEQVKEQVLVYYQANGESYPSDVANALNFDLERVINAVYRLEEEGDLEG